MQDENNSSFALQTSIIKFSYLFFTYYCIDLTVQTDTKSNSLLKIFLFCTRLES